MPGTGGTVLNTGTTSYTASQTSGTTIGTLKLNGTSYTLAYTNTTYSAATTSANGLMSSTDKTKLDKYTSSPSDLFTHLLLS